MCVINIEFLLKDFLILLKSFFEKTQNGIIFNVNHKLKKYELKS